MDNWYVSLAETCQQLSETVYSNLGHRYELSHNNNIQFFTWCLKCFRNHSAITGRNLPGIPWGMVLTYGPKRAITFVIMPTKTEFIIHTILVTPEVVWLVWSVPIVVGKLFPTVVPHIHTFLCYIRGPQPNSFSENQPQLFWNRTINDT